jgi:hypothetical protein
VESQGENHCCKQLPCFTAGACRATRNEVTKSKTLGPESWSPDVKCMSPTTKVLVKERE